MLVSRVWLDFGDGFTAPTNGPYGGYGTMTGVNPQDFFDALVGTGNKPGSGTVFRYYSGLMSPLTITPNYILVSTFGLFGLGSPDLANPYPALTTDALTFELAVTAQIQRALEPFDIEVYSSANSPFFTGVFPVAGGTAAQLGNASLLMSKNNLPGDGGSPINGTATVPQGKRRCVCLFRRNFPNRHGRRCPSSHPREHDLCRGRAKCSGRET